MAGTSVNASPLLQDEECRKDGTGQDWRAGSGGGIVAGQSYLLVA